MNPDLLTRDISALLKTLSYKDREALCASGVKPEATLAVLSTYLNAEPRLPGALKDDSVPLESRAGALFLAFAQTLSHMPELLYTCRIPAIASAVGQRLATEPYFIQEVITTYEDLTRPPEA